MEYYQNRYISFPPENSRTKKLTFEQLDEIPYIDDKGNVIDHKNSERDEQMIAKNYIIPSDSVLELGGRFGTVSCVINNILDNPTKHIVIEPDDTVTLALLNNRKTHHSFFTVYQNVISEKPQKILYNGLSTRTIDIDDQDTPIPSITLKEIIDLHNIKFTALVADCEGCFEDFVIHHKEFIKQLRLITYEQDYAEVSNYANVEAILKEYGFTKIKEGFHTVWTRQ
jgi:hypothetical protein